METLIKSPSPKELSAEKLRKNLDPATFSFETTEEIKEYQGNIGHNRAIQAIQFGLDIKAKGFNIFCLGEPGSGKTSVLSNLLREKASTQPTPNDWVYVYNFEEPDFPKAYAFPPGEGSEFKKDLEGLFLELKKVLPKIKELKQYQEEVKFITDQFESRMASLYKKLQNRGLKNDIRLDITGGDIVIDILKDGKTLTDEEFSTLSKEDQGIYEKAIIELKVEVTHFTQTQRKLEKERDTRIRKLENSIILNRTKIIIDELQTRYKKVKGIKAYLEKAWKSIPENFQTYKQAQEECQEDPQKPKLIFDEFFSAYKVNLLVDNNHTKGAPVIFETSPTYNNLGGFVEYREQFGLLVTDFTLIKAGAMHKANGGYLVIQLNELMKHNFAWDLLKTALRHRIIKVQEADSDNKIKQIITPKPEPIPLNLKVILIGTADFYYYLLNNDEEFQRLFKVKADFDASMPRTEENITGYTRFIAKIIKEDNLLPFQRDAVAKIIEFGSRRAEHQEKLTNRLIHIINIINESNYWAKNSHKITVEANDVRNALKERVERVGKIEVEMHKEISDGTILIDTQGLEIGQINGITVYELGDHSFGILCRITAKSYAGEKGIISIDREVSLTGQIHNKAAMILVGIIGDLYAQKRPLNLNASICFEQVYGEVEGDSASCAELFALISSIAQIPIKQSIAVTGSFNQLGEIQPIGAVNEKIEGAFKIFRDKGLNGKQGVIIPIQNVQNLMLDEDVVEAVKQGLFHIYPITHFREGLQIITGIKAGERMKSGAFEPGTIHYLAEQRLQLLSKKLR